jgi:hypothetical protein
MDLGTELPRRLGSAWIFLAMAAVLAVPCLGMAVESADVSGPSAAAAWAGTVAMTLLLVGAPLGLAREVLVRRTFLSDETVSIVKGGRLHQQVAYADLTEVRVRVSGQGGGRFRNERVVLVGPLRAGRGAVLVSRLYVESVRPLLDRLSVEVAQRPGLLTSEVERDWFDQVLATAR